MARKRVRNCLFFILILLVFGFLMSRSFGEEEVPVETPTTVNTSVKLLSSSSLEKNSSTLIAYGTVEASQTLDLVFETSGTVEALYIQPGSWVEEGALLAQLNADSLATQIDQAEAAYDAVYNTYLSLRNGADPLEMEVAESQLEAAEYQLEYLEETLDDSEASHIQLDIQQEVVYQYYYQMQMIEQGADSVDLAAQWAYVEQAQASLNSAYAAYDMTRLYAPVTGEIVSLSIQENEYVNATQALGVIINRDDIEAVAYLSSEDVEQISVGNGVLVDERYEAEVVGISSQVDESTQKRKVRIQMEALEDLTVGDTVRLELDQNAPEDGVTLVPLTAVLFDDDDAYVFFYYDGAVYRKRVEYASIQGNYLEIIHLPNASIVEDVAGLKHGDEVRLRT